MQLPVKDKSPAKISTTWHVVACPNLKKPLYSESVWHNLLASYFHTLRNKLYCKSCTPTSTDLTPVRMEPDWLVSSFQSCDMEVTKTGRHKNRWNSILCLPVTYPSTWMEQQQLYLALQARTWSSLLGSGPGSCGKVSGYLYPPATIYKYAACVVEREYKDSWTLALWEMTESSSLPLASSHGFQRGRRRCLFPLLVDVWAYSSTWVVGRQVHPCASAHL